MPASACAIAAASWGRTSRVVSWPSRRKTSVGHSLTLKARPQRPSLAVLDLQVPHLGMRGQGLRDQRLRALAPAAPRSAELEQQGAVAGVDLGAGRFGDFVLAAHGHGGTPDGVVRITFPRTGKLCSGDAACVRWRGRRARPPPCAGLPG